MLPDSAPFVVGLFLCAGSQSVAFCFVAKVLKSWNMQFSYECCAFLHTLAVALNAAIASNSTRSRCLAANIWVFAEFTSWVMLTLNMDVHHSAPQRLSLLNICRCWGMSQTSNFRRILALGFVTQFGSFWPPRVLQRCLLVSVIGGKWPSGCEPVCFK